MDGPSLVEEILRIDVDTEALVRAILMGEPWDDDSEPPSPTPSHPVTPRALSPTDSDIEMETVSSESILEGDEGTPIPIHPITMSGEVAPSLSGKKRRQRERKKKQRARRRAEEQLHFAGRIKSTSAKRLAEIQYMKVDSTSTLSSTTIARGGYGGKFGKRGAVGGEWSLSRLNTDGIRVIPWDGRSVNPLHQL